MKAAPYSVPLAKNGRELIQRGTPLFPCSIYQRDVKQYVTGEITPHWHREMELFILESGSVHMNLPDSGFDIRCGEGYFVNSNILHGVSCRFDESCRYRSIVFDPIIISGAPGSAFDTLYVTPFAEKGNPAFLLNQEMPQASALFSLFDAAFYACKDEADGYEFVVRNALSQILLILKKQGQDFNAKKASQQDLRIKQMISWIDSHYSDPVTVSQLAAAAGVCVRECQKIFSASLHLSPMQYLARRRIAAAAEELEYTDLPVCEIAMNCGFENASYFAKQFREIVGLSPREYRRGKSIV